MYVCVTYYLIVIGFVGVKSLIILCDVYVTQFVYSTWNLLELVSLCVFKCKL